MTDLEAQSRTIDRAIADAYIERAKREEADRQHAVELADAIVNDRSKPPPPEGDDVHAIDRRIAALRMKASRVAADIGRTRSEQRLADGDRARAAQAEAHERYARAAEELVDALAALVAADQVAARYGRPAVGPQHAHALVIPRSPEMHAVACRRNRFADPTGLRYEDDVLPRVAA